MLRSRRRRNVALRCAVSVILAALAMALWSPSASALATTLYVGGGPCSDTGSGTQSLPYCTISKAASVAVAGQTVSVAAGSYAESVNVAHSGSPGSPIVFAADSGASVIVTGGTNGFVVSGRQYVTISGFTITGTSSYGIKASSSSNIVIANNEVSRAGRPVSGYIAVGIYLSGTTNSTVTRNHAHHNSNHGIYVSSGSTDNVISFNESSFNARQYIRGANGVDVIAARNSVIGNRLHDNEDSGLQHYPGADYGLATLNASYNNGDHGIDDLNVHGGRLIGNTVYHNCTSGIHIEGTSSNYVVRNNIAVDNAVFVVNPTPMQFVNDCKRRVGNIAVYDSAPATTIVGSNLVWLSVPGTMYTFGTKYQTLAAMQAATGQEHLGLQANPAFLGAAAGDLGLAAGSPAIDSADSGASGEQNLDILGAPRTDDPSITDTGVGPRTYDDRGAYERQP